MARERLGEFEFIARLLRPLASGVPGAEGLGDDTAHLSPPAGHEIVVTTDALVCGVHFLAHHPPDLIARKALRVNVSDVAAAGGRPWTYQLALALSDDIDDAWLAAFCDGLAFDQREYGMDLTGGDTVSTPGPLTISVTALGVVPTGQSLGRAGAKVGDAVFVSGTIGDGALGLRASKGELEGAGGDDGAALAARYLLPQPRTVVGPRLRGLVGACMDVSDGLIGDLGHICARSAVAAAIDVERVPLSDPARRAIDRDASLLRLAISGGDDYELLFTAPASAREALAELSREVGVPLTEIGRIEAGRGVTAMQGGKPMSLERTSYRHR
ncbi:MAG: thiamine-phosphate kinase [Alphaproteobacteria bacterium]|nr:thiamine-phosphate kinase [Alphaproteobacteria bacterium]MCW5739566.1 thiamine-phosphate kinase [Alphaproteobacteria bacterium]